MVEKVTRTPRRTRAPVREPAREQVREEPVRELNRSAAPRLSRSRKRSEDKYFVDQKIVPRGVSYEWKRMSCYGQPDPDHINNLQDNHWTPVPQDRHPNLVVKKDGMILMERPAYLTDEARQEDYDLAIGQVQSVRQNVSDTPQGQFDRNHPSARRATKVSSDYNLAIPGDE